MLEWLKEADYLGLWVAFLLLTLLALWVGDRAGPRLENKGKAPSRPMIAFEMAGDADKAQEVLNKSEDADPNARAKFKTALGWDFLFIFIYPLCGAVGCLLVIKYLLAHELPGVPPGFVLLALLPAAALLDAVENYSLLKVLRGPIENPWPQVARWCAIPKFAIVGLVLLYELYGVATWAVTKVKGG
ncbi:MAG TPA: hypothetical protein VN256_11850 [Pyrinomonadaceae bacterium]|nr:hypothetical protein [Pyrinomonadaceae bacterium]